MQFTLYYVYLLEPNIWVNLYKLQVSLIVEWSAQLIIQ